MHPTRTPRVLLLALALLTVALVGCLGNETDDGDAPGTPGERHAPDAAEMAGAGPFSLFLCQDGYRVGADALAVVDRCNHRVTKPLVDPGQRDPAGDRPDVRTQHGPANEVSIAVNPTDALNLAGGAKDYTVSYVSDVAECGEYTVWMGTFSSHDGGLTWTNDLMRGFPGDDRESPLTGNQCNTDPVLVYDDDGTLWYSGLNYDGAREDTSTAASPLSGHDALSGSQLYFAKSEDGGGSYPDISFAAAGDDGVIFNDKQWFAVQPGGDHMIATWSQFVIAGPAGFATDVIAYTESLDGGATWSPQKILRPGGDVGGQDPSSTGIPAAGQFSMPQYLPGASATDPAMDLAVIWWDGEKVLYAEGQLTSGGAEFGPIQSTFPVNSLSSDPGRDGTGPTEYRLSTYPVLAVDPGTEACDGRRYVIWPDQEGEVNTDVEVLLRHSDDGLTWSEPITVNDESQSDQLMPWIDVDPEGGVHAVWYDKRHDADNRLMDVYYGYSADCGETWTNLRVTETSFDGDLAHHQNGSPFIGDYIGVDTTAESAHIIWADTRHSCPTDAGTCEAPMRIGSDVYAATLLKDLDARATFDAAFQG
ncbi:MAG: sialidase family protein [Candidatus Thermoplasmatota archaeon]|nr:sialidase family protein [Candidatus Thermoplasmatota archaeon]